MSESSATRTGAKPLERTREEYASLQQWVCAELERVEGRPSFVETLWRRDAGRGRTFTLAGGEVFELAVCELGAIETRVPGWLAERRPALAAAPARCVELALNVWSTTPRLTGAQLVLRRVETERGSWLAGGCIALAGEAEAPLAWGAAIERACAKTGLLDAGLAGGEARWRLDGGTMLGAHAFWLDDAQGLEVPDGFERGLVQAVVDAYVTEAAARRSEPFERAEREAQLLARSREIEHRVRHEATSFGATRRPLPPSVRWVRPALDAALLPEGVERRAH